MLIISLLKVGEKTKPKTKQQQKTNKQTTKKDTLYNKHQITNKSHVMVHSNLLKLSSYFTSTID